ncbi:DUF6114 domain-containing protein [Kitasatospora sp. NPDC004240]
MSSALAEYRPAEHENPVQWLRRAFRTFRRTRPYYGGLLAMFAGVPILYFPYAKLSLGGMTVSMSTTAGAGSLIIGVLLIVLGLTAWFQPAIRIFAGVATTLLTLVAIPVSNLAGFGLSLLPGLIGGGLMIAWAPLPPKPAVEEADEAEAGTAERTATEQEPPTDVLPVVPEQAALPEPGAQPTLHLEKPVSAEGGIPQQPGGPKEVR